MSLTEHCLSSCSGVLSNRHPFMKSSGYATEERCWGMVQVRVFITHCVSQLCLVSKFDHYDCICSEVVAKLTGKQQQQQKGLTFSVCKMICWNTLESLKHDSTWLDRGKGRHNHRAQEIHHLMLHLIAFTGFRSLNTWSASNVSDLATEFCIARHVAKHPADMMVPLHGWSN